MVFQFLLPFNYFIIPHHPQWYCKVFAALQYPQYSNVHNTIASGDRDLLIFSQSWHCVCCLHLFQLVCTIICRDVWTKVINDHWRDMLLVSNSGFKFRSLDIFLSNNDCFYFRLFILSFTKPMTWTLYVGSVYYWTWCK